MWPCSEFHQETRPGYEYTSKKVSFLLDHALLLICLPATNVLHVFSMFAQDTDSNSRPYLQSATWPLSVSQQTSSTQCWCLLLHSSGLCCSLCSQLGFILKTGLVIWIQFSPSWVQALPFLFLPAALEPEVLHQTSPLDLHTFGSSLYGLPDI